MKTNKITKWIVNLSPIETFFLFGLFLPFHVIWYRQVGLYVIKKNNRNNKLFNILFTLLLIVIFYFFFIESRLQFSEYNMPVWSVPIWLFCNVLMSKNMIDLVNKENEYFYGYRKYTDYILRFVQLLFFPLFIYWIQQELIMTKNYLNPNEVTGVDNGL